MVKFDPKSGKFFEETSPPLRQMQSTGCGSRKIQDVGTLHRHIQRALEERLDLHPIWEAIDRKSLQISEDENIQLLEAHMGGTRYLIKIDADGRYCDILRITSFLDYFVWSLRLGEALSNMEGIVLSTKRARVQAARISHAVLEATALLLEDGNNLEFSGMFLSKDYIYPEGFELSIEQAAITSGMNLYETVRYLVDSTPGKNTGKMQVKVHFHYEANIPVDLSIPSLLEQEKPIPEQGSAPRERKKAEKKLKKSERRDQDEPK